MTINRTLRKLNIKYRKRAQHPDTPYHKTLTHQNLAENENSKRTQKTLVLNDESYFTFPGCKNFQTRDIIHKMSNKHLGKQTSTLQGNLSLKY